MVLEKQQRVSILMAEFSWGGQVQVRLCSSDSPITITLGGLSDVYLSDPLLSYSSVERTGNVEEESGTLTTSLELDFVLQAASGKAFPPITIKVFEITSTTLTGSPVDVEKVYWDRGYATQLEVNPDGEAGTAKWTVQNVKSQMKASMPLVCDDLCINKFGSGKICEFDIEAATETGTLTAADANTLTITGLSVQPIDYWPDGFIEAAGYRLRILTFDGVDTFVTLQLPPSDWIDALPLSVSVEPGCGQTRLQCALFDQLHNFNGLGVAMESRNPLFQLPR